MNKLITQIQMLSARLVQARSNKEPDDVIEELEDQLEELNAELEMESENWYTDEESF